MAFPFPHLSTPAHETMLASLHFWLLHHYSLYKHLPLPGNDLSPEAAAAAATSRATFSFVENSKYIPASLATSIKTSPISEEGVPGYVAATEMPFSRAPRTTASFPSRYNLVPGFAVSMSLISLIPPCQLCAICMSVVPDPIDFLISLLPTLRCGHSLPELSFW